MENLKNDQEQTGGQQKVNEYISRIKAGESKDKIFEGLPSSFREAIENGLTKDTKSENASSSSPAVPPEAVAAREQKDQERINEIHKELGIQKKKVQYDDDEHERAIGIYNTMTDIAAGASEGLKEDIEWKIQKYVDEIKSGKNEDYVLQGLPDKWKASVRERLETADINYEQLSPEDVLRKLAEYSEPYMSAPLEAVADGSFAGIAKLKIEDGNIVLVRHAADVNHLIKDGKEATGKEMMDSSLFLGGAHNAGAIHTSADIENWSHRYDQYPVYGEFRIPVRDFLALGKASKIIIGNLSEAEIVLSGEVAKKYLTKVIEKK